MLRARGKEIQHFIFIFVVLGCEKIIDVQILSCSRWFCLMMMMGPFCRHMHTHALATTRESLPLGWANHTWLHTSSLSIKSVNRINETPLLSLNLGHGNYQNISFETSSLRHLSMCIYFLFANALDWTVKDSPSPFSCLSLHMRIEACQQLIANSALL